MSLAEGTAAELAAPTEVRACTGGVTSLQHKLQLVFIIHNDKHYLTHHLIWKRVTRGLLLISLTRRSN
jgi:hypothetical protein